MVHLQHKTFILKSHPIVNLTYFELWHRYSMAYIVVYLNGDIQKSDYQIVVEQDLYIHVFKTRMYAK